MAAKVISVFCATLLVQSAYSAFLGGIASPYGLAGTGCGYNSLVAPTLAYEGFAAPTLAYDGFAGPARAYEAGFGCGFNGVASTGGGLPCASASSIPPVGVSVLSENAYAGSLAAGGNLPFLGTVAVDGVLPTAGAGAVSYGCGNSLCAIGAEEGAITTGIKPHAPYAYAPYGAYSPAVAGYNGCGGLGYGYGAAGFGAGCGGVVY